MRKLHEWNTLRNLRAREAPAALATPLHENDDSHGRDTIHGQCEDPSWEKACAKPCSYQEKKLPNLDAEPEQDQIRIIKGEIVAKKLGKPSRGTATVGPAVCTHPEKSMIRRSNAQKDQASDAKEKGLAYGWHSTRR